MSAERRAEWEERLGTANLRVGAFPSAARHLLVALDRLGAPLPSDVAGALLRARALYELRRLLPRCCGGSGGASAEAEAAAIEEAMMKEASNETLVLALRSLSEVAVLTEDVQIARYCRALITLFSGGARRPILRLLDCFINCGSVLVRPPRRRGRICLSSRRCSTASNPPPLAPTNISCLPSLACLRPSFALPFLSSAGCGCSAAGHAAVGGRVPRAAVLVVPPGQGGAGGHGAGGRRRWSEPPGGARWRRGDARSHLQSALGAESQSLILHV